jgi:hypothetical protein
VDGINLAQDEAQRRALVNTTMNPLVQNRKAEKFLASSAALDSEGWLFSMELLL